MTGQSPGVANDGLIQTTERSKNRLSDPNDGEIHRRSKRRTDTRRSKRRVDVNDGTIRTTERSKRRGDQNNN